MDSTKEVGSAAFQGTGFLIRNDGIRIAVTMSRSEMKMWMSCRLFLRASFTLRDWEIFIGRRDGDGGGGVQESEVREMQHVTT